MELVSQQEFESTAVRHFESIAAKRNFAFHKAAPGIFEISGNGFILRIRRGVGHLRGAGDFVVTLSTSQSAQRDINDLSGEIGLRNFVEYYHGSLPFQEFGRMENFDKAMTEAVAATEKYCVPILLGDANSFEAVRKFVDQKIEISVMKCASASPRNEFGLE